MPDTKKAGEICKAASQCFARYGYAKTTMDDIGKMVGLNKASLYYYYKSKEAIFCEIIRIERRDFLVLLKRKTASVSAWDEKIQSYIRHRLRYIQDLTNLHKLSVKTTRELHFQPIFQDLVNEFYREETLMIKEILDQAVLESLLPGMDTERGAALILTIANGIKLHQAMRHTGDFILDQVDYRKIEDDTRFAVDLVLKGMRAG